MHHRGRRALMAFGPLALVVGLLVGPAMASATVKTVTLETNAGPLMVGDPIVAVSHNLVTTTVAGDLACTTTKLEGEVTRNGGALFAGVGDITGVAKGGGALGTDCGTTVPGLTGADITVEGVAPIDFYQDGSDSTFTVFEALLTPVGAICFFEGQITTSFTPGVPLGDKVGPSALVVYGATCPIAGTTAVIEGEFEVESGGNAVWVDVS